MILGLKVDVDTYVGTRDGVPRLLELFGRTGVTATFFLSVGPDNSGKAVRRVFTRRGFVSKMRHSNALQMYGLRTMLSGTLLPASLIGKKLAPVLRDVEAAGHETEFHSYDHVHWHDFLPRMSEQQVREHLRRGWDAFTNVFGRAPRATAAPGWACTGNSLRVEDDLGCRYNSNSRGHSPCLPRCDGYTGIHPELPTTLPTVDELLGTGMSAEECVAALADADLRPDYNVFTLHSEVEGGPFFDSFDRLLRQWQERGVKLVPLRDLAAALPSSLPVCELAPGTLPGRAGTVTVQGNPVA